MLRNIQILGQKRKVVDAKHRSIIHKHYFKVWTKRCSINHLAETFLAKRNKILQQEILRALELQFIQKGSQRNRIMSFTKTRNFFAVKRGIVKLHLFAVSQNMKRQQLEGLRL